MKIHVAPPKKKQKHLKFKRWNPKDFELLEDVFFFHVLEAGVLRSASMLLGGDFIFLNVWGNDPI